MPGEANGRTVIKTRKQYERFNQCFSNIFLVMARQQILIWPRYTLYKKKTYSSGFHEEISKKKSSLTNHFYHGSITSPIRYFVHDLCLEKFDVNHKNFETLLGKCTSKNFATLYHSETDVRAKKFNARQCDTDQTICRMLSKYEIFAAHRETLAYTTKKMKYRRKRHSH